MILVLRPLDFTGDTHLCDTLKSEIWEYPLDVVLYVRSSYYSNNVCLPISRTH